MPDAVRGDDPEMLASACDFLEHYHECHAKEPITRFRNKNGADIYVVSDPELKALLGKTTDYLFVETEKI